MCRQPEDFLLVHLLLSTVQKLCIVMITARGEPIITFITNLPYGRFVLRVGYNIKLHVRTRATHEAKNYVLYLSATSSKNSVADMCLLLGKSVMTREDLI